MAMTPREIFLYKGLFQSQLLRVADTLSDLSYLIGEDELEIAFDYLSELEEELAKTLKKQEPVRRTR